MHPEIIRDSPGKCPGCGMDLIQKTGTHADHDMTSMSHVNHEAAMTNPQMAKQMEADMRQRFFISLALTIPIVLYSTMGEMLFGISLPSPIPKNILLFLFVGFSAGSLIGAAFLHLLPEALGRTSTTNVFLATILGFVLFFLLEKYLYWRHCHDGICDVHTFTYLNLIGDAN